MFSIKRDDLSGEASRQLLALHLRGMHASSPPEHSFALDLSGLTAPGVSAWSAWDDDTIVAIGALKDLGDGTGEVKSMRTHPDHLRRGAAAQLLDHIIAEARSRSYSQLSLETGRGPAFEAALALYRERGFTEGEPFADYRPSAFNRLFHLPLAGSPSPRPAEPAAPEPMRH
jgi:putative acetyltransferase